MSNMPIIDIHTHLLTAGAEPSMQELDLAEGLAHANGIDKLVLLANVTAMGGPDPSPEHISVMNTHTLGVMASKPDLYIGFCYLNPAHPVEFINAEIDRCIVQGGMLGIKLWIAVKCTDARLDPIMQRAAELKVPVMHHAWYKQTVYACQESTPAEIAVLACRWPQVTIIMAHLSGARERGVCDIAAFPNVLVDTAGSQPDAGIVEYAVRRLGAERVLYGSDWPLRDFGVQLGRVTGARLSDSDLELIMYKNAGRVLGLSGARS